MTTKRWYEDGCMLAHALNLVGERWALLVVRELLLGPKRFTDLRHGLPAVNPNVLARRLRELEQRHVVHRRRLPAPVSSQVYELTDWGKELEPIVTGLGLWGYRSLTRPIGAPVSVDSVVLGLKTLFDAKAAKGFSIQLMLCLGDDRFVVKVSRGRIEVSRGEFAGSDATLSTGHTALSRLLSGELDLEDTVSSGELTIDGDPASVRRFFTFFPTPEKVGAASGAGRV